TFGLKADDIEQTTSVIQDAQNNVVWSVIQTTAPLDQAKVRAALKEASDTEIEGKKCIAGFLGSAPSRAMPPAVRDSLKFYAHFAGEKVLILGQQAGIRKAITTAAKRPSGALDEELDGMGVVPPSHVKAAGIVPAQLVQVARQNMQGNPQMAKLVPLL